jgi:hypothetical protein
MRKLPPVVPPTEHLHKPFHYLGNAVCKMGKPFEWTGSHWLSFDHLPINPEKLADYGYYYHSVMEIPASPNPAELSEFIVKGRKNAEDFYGAEFK